MFSNVSSPETAHTIVLGAYSGSVYEHNKLFMRVLLRWIFHCLWRIQYKLLFFLRDVYPFVIHTNMKQVVYVCEWKSCHKTIALAAEWINVFSCVSENVIEVWNRQFIVRGSIKLRLKKTPLRIIISYIIQTNKIISKKNWYVKSVAEEVSGQFTTVTFHRG